jgi:hypothetical protein
MLVLEIQQALKNLLINIKITIAYNHIKYLFDYNKIKF